MAVLSAISELILSGFVLTTMLLSIAYWFLSKQRQIIQQFIVLSNVFLIIGSILFLTVTIQQIISPWIGNDEWERLALTNRLMGPYWFAYWGAILYKGILPQILWMKNVRHNVWTSLALLPLLLIEYYMPFFYPSNPGHFPSHWAMRFSFSELFVNSIIFALALTTTHFVLKKKAMS